MTTIDPNAGDRLSIAVNETATIVDYCADETEEVITIVLDGDIAKTSGGYRHEIRIEDLDRMGIDWQAPTAKQLVALCRDEKIGIFAPAANNPVVAVSGWIVQRQEDHPRNPGWWRFGRPYWVATDAELPTSGFPESVRWNWGTRAALAEAQAEWDRSNPGG